MKLIKDDSAQAGGIAMFVLVVFIIGFIYIILSGTFWDFLYTFHNTNIGNSILPESQARKDAMGSMFAFWWVFPVFVIIFLVVWAIENAIKAKTEEIY